MNNIFNNFKKEKPFNNTVHPRGDSLKITLKYGIYGVLWILLSDRILAVFVEDTHIYMRYQTFKGWFYVILTMGLLYILIYNRLKTIKESNDSLEATYMEIHSMNHDLLETKNELQYMKKLNQNIIDISPILIFTMSSDGSLIRINSYGQNLFGYSENELSGKDWISVLVNKDDVESVRDLLNKSMENNYKKTQYFESTFIDRFNNKIDLLWNISSLNQGDESEDKFLGLGIDITEKNKYEASIKKMAFTDKLTGLPNRIMFENTFGKIIFTNYSRPFSILYIDFDNFKYINDTLGHQVGDSFLLHIGNLFKLNIKNPNYVARISGDEFAIITDNTSEEKTLEYILAIKDFLGNTWQYYNYNFYISISIGIVSYPQDGEDINTLLKNAEIAMYVAKKQGKNKAIFYKDDLSSSNSWHIDMAHKIHLAMENNEFSLYFQPQFELESNKIIGAETLIRWNHPRDGFISPAYFIPVAEETGQIFNLEQWIFKTALEQKKVWEEAGLDYIGLSINLSAKTLLSDEYFKALENLLSSYYLNYYNLTIEITETSIISNLNLVIKRLNKLKTKGIKIALDDFGTGYSSITYLKKLPIDIIKLEKSFIDLVLSDERDSLIVKSILNLANDLNFSIIAEGIETKEQLKYLVKYKCKNGQGYLLSKPLPVSQVTDLFIKNKNI